MKLSALVLLLGLTSVALTPVRAQNSNSGAIPAQAVPAGSMASDSGQSSDTESTRRARERLKTDLSQQESACRRGFWVNSCLEKAREKFRLDLAELDRVERELESQRRQQRTQVAQERVRDKQQTLQDRTAASSPPLTDEEIERRIARAQQDRAEQAQERSSRQQQKQRTAEQRNQSREAAARERRERAERSPPAGSDARGSSPGPADAVPQTAR